jgi:hypothetical protein
VYFSIFIVASLSLPLSPEGTAAASSLGFRPAALTFLNQPAVVAIIIHIGLTQMWAFGFQNGRGLAMISGTVAPRSGIS